MSKSLMMRAFARRVGSGRLQEGPRRLRVWPNFPNRFKLICPVQSSRKKIIRFTSDPNHRLIHSHPVPTEGRFAIVTNVGRDAVDAKALLTNSAQADGDVVWF